MHAVSGKTELFENVNIDWNLISDEHLYELDYSDDDLDAGAQVRVTHFIQLSLTKLQTMVWLTTLGIFNLKKYFQYNWLMHMDDDWLELSSLIQ